MTNPEIEQLIRERTGLLSEALGAHNIERAVAAAMEKAGVPDEAAYLALLLRSEPALPDLIEELVVLETWFFRDREPFIFLGRRVREALPPFNVRRRFRFLSAPCSTGEEAYSIAITLLEAGLTPDQFQIDAVDLSATAILRARRADYGERAFRGKMTANQADYFQRLFGRLVLDPTVARLVNFQVDNLVHPVFLAKQAPYEAVFCRNMIIYLAAEARALVVRNLERLLAPGGILVVGHSELSFFQQAGYIPVSHARSFACMRGGEGEREKAKAREQPRPARRPAHAAPAVSAGIVIPPPPAVGERPAAPTPETDLAAVRRLADRGELEKARALCARILKEQPACAEAYCLQGLIHQAAGRPAEAEACYLKAVYLDPRCLEALVHLGLHYARQGDAAKAALFRERARRAETAGG
jgi:chemotaxis protein methyltransferase WspC